MTDRRFNEDEVAAIFERATLEQPSPQHQLPSGEGLTLAELHEIGRQVGVAPEVVSRAAAALTQAGTPTSRKLLGLPIGVGRTVDLDRKLSADEWDRLIVDLRETFDARGTTRQDGSFRQWTNGNLQVLVEPTPNGQRIRMRTTNGAARTWLTGSVAMLTVAAAGVISAVAGGHLADWNLAVVLTGFAGSLFAIGAARLPAWARLRAKQMEEIAGRVALAPAALPPENS